LRVDPRGKISGEEGRVYMWARLSRFAGLPPERIDHAIHEFRDEQLPAFEKLPGFEGVAIMVDRGAGKAAAITYWESREALRESDKLADRAREQAVQTTQPARDPIVDRYEVVFERSPAKSTA
jgi:heme-degrading monooxygenase HmoA